MTAAVALTALFAAALALGAMTFAIALALTTLVTATCGSAIALTTTLLTTGTIAHRHYLNVGIAKAVPRSEMRSSGTSIAVHHVVDADIRVGTAGWSIPRASAPGFDSDGTHLQRYSAVLRCAEINSSFYRPHSATTYAKWRDSTPPDFRFAVKMPRTITHELKLRDAREPLVAFLNQTDGLSEKRGPLLLQLPPSLSFDAALVSTFLTLVREAYRGSIVCEPRHATWFEPAVAAFLHGYRVARVAADPPPAPAGTAPAGWPQIAYFRLHGSPRTYWSRYDQPYIAALAAHVRAIPSAEEVWCIFDNTASGAATDNACELIKALLPSQT